MDHEHRSRCESREELLLEGSGSLLSDAVSWPGLAAANLGMSTLLTVLGEKNPI